MQDNNLQLGDSGDLVRILQEKLKILGFYNAIITGDFGLATEAGVIAFQQTYDLEPTGVVNIMAFEQATSYLFGYSNKGINFFPIQGDWNIADNLFISWDEIKNFKMKNGLLENEMIIETSSMKIEMKINKTVANNSWVKDNINYLKEKGYFYNL